MTLAAGEVHSGTTFGYTNNAPSVSITAPADGTTVNDGTAINFTGTASDSEDGDLTAAIGWTSSIDGALGTGGSVNATLSIGTHTITATVNDSGGLPASDVISVNVLTEPVTVIFSSIGAEDGWVRESNENSDVGGASNSGGSGARPIRPGDANADRQYKSILSFDTLSIPAGATIIEARFRLTRGSGQGTSPFQRRLRTVPDRRQQRRVLRLERAPEVGLRSGCDRGRCGSNA